jgi:pimeloyl-ACP methyl ester carboxylesterase
VRADTAVLIGHSLGSVVAYEALCAHPEWSVRAFDHAWFAVPGTELDGVHHLAAALANAEGIYRLQVGVVSEVGDEPGTMRLAGSDLNGYELLLPFEALRQFVLDPRVIHDRIGYGLARPHAVPSGENECRRKDSDGE